MKRKVYLEGELGRRYGSERVIEADTVADIIKCLSANFESFKHYLNSCVDKGLGIKIKVNDTIVDTVEELYLLYGKGDVIITIVPAGSKSKFLKVLVGAAILAVGWWTGIPMLQQFGLSMMIGGIAELLAPDPESAKDIKTDTGYIYSGTAQVVQETDPVPICYGRIRIPGRPVSFEIRNASTVITN